MHLNTFILTKGTDEDDDHCKLIHSLEYLVKIVKDHGNVKKGEEPTYNLVLREDDLNHCLFVLEYQGHEPSVSHA